MKKFNLMLIFLFLCLPFLTSCSISTRTGKYITIYNAGDYLDPTVLSQFEKETGIKILYEEFDTNEIMYTKATAKNATYDVICPSDYMIERLIKEKRLLKIDKNLLPNIKNLDNNIINLTKSFDKNIDYNVPYCYGTVGLLYNTKYVSKDEVKSWNVLWDPKYEDEILMPDSVRDIMAIALKKNHFSLNTSDKKELEIAEKDLKKQKKLTQAYVNDQVRDKMIAEEAKIGVIYSGEALFTMEYNDNLDYHVPEEGSNAWIDSWVIPKTCHDIDIAHKFINYMCRPDVALKNYEYLTYSTPNLTARNMAEDEALKTSEIVIPSLETLNKCETMHNLDYGLNRKYNEIFMRVKCY